MIGAAVVGAGASIISGNRAARATTDAADQSNALQERIYNQSRSDNEPWRQVGISALGKLAKIYGVSPQSLMPSYQGGVAGNYGGGDFGAPAGGVAGNYGGAADSANDNDPFAGFYASPDYQYRLGEGMKAIERSAAARGNLRSGATMRAIGNHAQGEASKEWNTYVDRLSSLAGVGQSATASNAALGQSYAANASNTIMNAGNARASAYANTGSAINNGVQNVAAAYLYNRGYGPRTGTGG
jgi:hypothetical protein